MYLYSCGRKVWGARFTIFGSERGNFAVGLSWAWRESWSVCHDQEPGRRERIWWIWGRVNPVACIKRASEQARKDARRREWVGSGERQAILRIMSCSRRRSSGGSSCELIHKRRKNQKTMSWDSSWTLVRIAVPRAAGAEFGTVHVTRKLHFYKLTALEAKIRKSKAQVQSVVAYFQ